MRCMQHPASDQHKGAVLVLLGADQTASPPIRAQCLGPLVLQLYIPNIPLLDNLMLYKGAADSCCDVTDAQAIRA